MIKKNKRVISVVIAAYNEEKYIRNCLTSVLNQDFPYPYEVIVCDNNSTDATSVILQEFPVIRVKEEKKNYVYALQKGIERAQGAIIALTDADTVVPPTWLSAILTAFDTNAHVVGVGGPYEFYDGQKFLRRFIHIVNALCPQLLTASLCGMNMAFRKDVYERIGGFATASPLQADTELAFRLKRQGRIIFLKHNIVSSSARRYRSFRQILKEITIRSVNIISLFAFRKTVVRNFQDFR